MQYSISQPYEHSFLNEELKNFKILRNHKKNHLFQAGNTPSFKNYFWK